MLYYYVPSKFSISFLTLHTILHLDKDGGEIIMYTESMTAEHLM